MFPLLCLYVVLIVADSATSTPLHSGQVLETVPVVYGGFDVIEYWKSNRAVIGSSKYPLNITSKDNNGISRIYQLQFSSQTNLDTFKNNETGYLFQYGGFCDWGVCCERAPDWPWTNSHMGPPGGFNSDMDGFAIQNEKLYVAFDAEYSRKFFNGNNDVNSANTRWIGWFGSLTEGVLNYMCLSYDTVQYEYCTQHGQPLAPAATPSDEIYPVIQNPPEWFNKFKGV